MASKTSKIILGIVIFLGIGVSGLLWESQQQQVLADALTQPALPARFFGAVTVNGSNAAAGTLLSAAIAGQVYATTTITLVQGVSSYVIDIPGDDPGTPQVDGGRAGAEVRFTLPGYTATERGIWQVGAVTALNLTLVTTPTPQPPAPPGPQRPVTIPEPVTLLLFGTGLAALTAWRRQRPEKRVTPPG